MKLFSTRREVVLKQSVATIPRVRTGEGIMWWVVSIGVLLAAYPLVDIVEEWRIGASARKQLARMRQHEAVGHRWDCIRGQWQN
jgi:hypothetical protein